MLAFPHGSCYQSTWKQPWDIRLQQSEKFVGFTIVLQETIIAILKLLFYQNVSDLPMWSQKRKVFRFT